MGNTLLGGGFPNKGGYPNSWCGCRWRWTCALASARGGRFPDGTPGPGPGNVLIFHGEDTSEDVINPRLEALGADRSKIFHVQRRNDLGPEPLVFPAHLALLDQVLARVRPVLVVIDPIMAFLDRTVACCDDVSVRRALGPLAQLAEKYRNPLDP